MLHVFGEQFLPTIAGGRANEADKSKARDEKNGSWPKAASRKPGFEKHPQTSSSPSKETNPGKQPKND
jgi:hypothetical protein